MSPRSRVTIRDVAARAGVSHQTISRVINASEQVSPETRSRVEAAIQELGYKPNAIARFMAKGRTRTFACLSPNLTDFTFACLIEGAESAARQQGYFIISASAPDEDAFATLVEELLTSNRTDGLLVINPYIDGRRSRLPDDAPTVFLGARPRNEPVSSVSLDEEGAGYIAAQHLIELGHRQIALITGPLCEDCSQDRRTGFAQALHQVGVAPDESLVYEGDWSATSGYLGAQQLLAAGHPFSAIFAQNDRMAVGAIRAVREAGLSVPADMSIIGFDDMPLASYFDPPLTTMRQDMFHLGREAVHMLVQAVEQPDSPRQHLRLPVELIVRGSTAKFAPQGGEA